MSETLAIGFAARSLVTACTMPVSVIKTRYESGRYSYRTVLQAGRDTLAKEGLRGEHALNIIRPSTCPLPATIPNLLSSSMHLVVVLLALLPYT